MNDTPSPFPQEGLAFAVEDNIRFPGLLAAYFHVLPAQLPSDAGAEGLGDGFLAGKARRQIGAGGFVREAVGQFGGAEDSLQESGAELFAGSFNALHFNDVNAGTEYQRSGARFKTGRLLPESLASCSGSATVPVASVGVSPTEGRPKPARHLGEFPTISLMIQGFFHGQQHLAHGGGQANHQGAADNAVPDVQFDQMRHLAQHGNVAVIQAMTGVDSQA